MVIYFGKDGKVLCIIIKVAPVALYFTTENMLRAKSFSDLHALKHTIRESP